MRSLIIAALGVALLAITPEPPHGGGGPPPQRAAAPPVRSAPQRSAPAYVPRPVQPVQRAPVPPTGFDLHGDTANSGRITPPQAQPRPAQGRYAGPIARSVPNLHRSVKPNPHHYGNWGWHNGTPWIPGAFWAGAFWGDYALGAVGDGDQYPLDFVPVVPGSPGYQLLSDYGLTQTDCNADPSTLVIIDGPDGSVICAVPNNLVGPGTYVVDPTTLTLESV